MLNTTQATPIDARAGRRERTGPVGRVVRLLLAVGFAYAFATLVDQGGPASVRDPEALTDAPFVVLTIAMVAVYAVLVTELAKIVAGEAIAKTALGVALMFLGLAAAVAAVVAEVRAGAVWGSPLSDLVWTLDAAMLFETIVALLSPSCWGHAGARSASGATSPRASAAGRPRRRFASSASTISTLGAAPPHRARTRPAPTTHAESVRPITFVLAGSRRR